MPKFIIEAEFKVPHLVRYCIEAKSPEAAMAEAQRREESGRFSFWDDQFQDFDNSSAVEWSDVSSEYLDPDGYDDGQRADPAG